MNSKLLLLSTAATLAGFVPTPGRAQQFTFNIDDGSGASGGAQPAPSGPVIAQVELDGDSLKPGGPYRIVVKAPVPRPSLNAGIDPQFLTGPDGSRLPLAGSNYSMSNINGRVTTSLMLSFEAEAPAKPGAYTLPAQEFKMGATTIRVPATSVIVRELAPGETVYTRATARLEVPAGPFYAGQEIPATIVITDSPDELVRQIGHVSFENDGTLAVGPGVRGVSQKEVVSGGQKVSAASFPVKLVAMTAGDNALAFKIELTVIRKSGAERALMRKVVSTETIRLRIDHTPESGKPASFAGAVGNFKVSPVRVSAESGKSGVPLKLTFSVTGEGALDRLSAPELSAPGWSVRREEPVGTEGVDGGAGKHFIYTITPLYGGHLPTPAGEFSWFDPQAGKYFTAPVASLPFEVEGPAAPAGFAEKKKDVPALAPDPVASGKSVAYASLSGSPAFLGANLIALLLLGTLAAVTGLRRGIASDPVRLKRIRSRRELKKHRSAAKRALAAGDAGAYAGHARAALRAGVSANRDDQAGALTGEETLDLLPVGVEIRAALRPLFTHEESLRFAGEPASADSLAETAKSLFETLETLETATR